VVLAQPDSFAAYDPPTGADPAWRVGDQVRSQEEVLAAAVDDPAVSPGGRLLTDVNPCSPDGVRTLLSPLLVGGGTVWVANPDSGSWEHRYDEERATEQLRTHERGT